MQNQTLYCVYTVVIISQSDPSISSSVLTSIFGFRLRKRSDLGGLLCVNLILSSGSYNE
jgi:hypothetical protein